MKKKVWSKIVSLVLVIATLVTTLPLTIFAEEIKDEVQLEPEMYIKDVILVQGKTKDEASRVITNKGYQFLDHNLNEGTGGDGIWLGFLATTDPNEAIYDMKIMNMKGGFTRTTMEEALAKQESAFAEMARDLKYLIDEFALAYREGSDPAKSAYRALNFFRMVEGETALSEENGLGYHFVNGSMTLSKITEMLLFCDPIIVDTVIKLLTMGIQARGGNWLRELSDMGPYDSGSVYMDDEDELVRRAEQLLGVLSLYSEVYCAMVKSGLMPDDLDENFEAVYDDTDKSAEPTSELGDPAPGDTPDGEDETAAPLTPEEADMQKFDEGRYKFYKLVENELSRYSYGEDETLKDFFVTLATEDNEKALYPLVSVLSDAEFAALSYGCFLEMVTSADAREEDFEAYDEVYDSFTEEQAPLYLYVGVDKALFDEDATVGFTDRAQQHMTTTGEYNFFEKANTDERIWEDGLRAAKIIGASFLAVIGISKIAVGTISMIAGVSTAVATAAKTGALAATLKYGMMVGSLKGLIIAAVLVALSVLISYLVALGEAAKEDEIDWEKNPMLDYIYDLKDATFEQTSEGGVQTGVIKRAVYALYEAVRDEDHHLIDLNARSEESTQWLQLFVTRDRQGVDSKPIKAEDLLVVSGNGVTPEDYIPVSTFGVTDRAYNLNTWDKDDTVNGVYVFFKQDKDVAVESETKYYISEVQLQTGESDAHCIALLEAAGYTPININISPELTDDDIVFEDKVYTYIGYKTSPSKNDAIRDIRIVYGPGQGNINFGAATYADCGSNGCVTLYATKYAIAGTPILEGGLIAVNKQADAPVGYEPVCLMSGGPAVPLNVDKDGRARADLGFIYFYFLPEVTFTSGKQYLGGLTVIDRGIGSLSAYWYDDHRNALPIQPEARDMWSKYVPATWVDVGVFKNIYNIYLSTLYYYPTYNPYRAIYSIKAFEYEDYTNSMNIDGTGYYTWNKTNWGYDWHKDSLSKDEEERTYARDMTVVVDPSGIDDYKGNGAFYLAGNDVAGNVYDTETCQMTEAEPMLLSDIVFFNAKEPGKINAPENFYPVIDSLNYPSDTPFIYHMNYLYVSIYTKTKNEDRKYVSGISAIDQFTLYRAYNKGEAEVSLDQITESMMYSYLAGQGANDIISYMPEMGTTSLLYNVFDMLEIVNKTKFGLTRTAKAGKALRDVFLYFNEFSTDEPPKALYRGSVKYSLLCEIPYNMLSDENAPSAGVYLYGATSSKAGERIVDIHVSSSPFIAGYETVRTMNGRSLVGEIKDYAKEQQTSNPVESARDFFENFYSWFDGDDGKDKLKPYYIHIKREKDTRAEDLYIEKLYLTHVNGNVATAVDTLFDRGADGYVQMDLNEGAGGPKIYLGYSYTEDPAKAIKEIRAYHEKSHEWTMKDDYGRTFKLVDDLDLNKSAGGNYIYLYYTTESSDRNPITSIYGKYSVNTGYSYRRFNDGTVIEESTDTVKMWDSNSYSDLNRRAGGEYVYLVFTTRLNPHVGNSGKTPSYGSDKEYSRDEFISQNPDGKYIGGLYVMDKETIRLEKIAEGKLPSFASCSSITDYEVFDRLKAMGATTIIETPISICSGAYFDENRNKAFIGYSRTDVSSLAIRHIALKAEIMSMDEPPENIDVDNKPFTLVAEAANDVTELPKAINLLALEDGANLHLPRLYLYYSTDLGSDPIYDISIDDIPLVNGWNTVRSTNLLDPFADIWDQAVKLRDATDNDDVLSRYQNIYKDQLVDWMSELADLFDPEEEEFKPFYIHVKRHNKASLEEVKPYIEKVYLAAAETEHAALSKLVAYEPDGFVEVELNRDAGGDKIFMAYKRGAKARNALTDIVVYEGEKFEPSRRITVGGESAKFTLVADIDLNRYAGGEYLYLYTTDSSNTGNPITDLCIKEDVESYLKCGVERVTVRRAEGNSYTDEQIDLNKGAGGDYLYLIMTRETDEGHTSNNIVTDQIYTDATCVEDGCRIDVTACVDCKIELETVAEVFKAHGEHIDDAEDGDHECDVCGESDVCDCIFDGYVVRDPDNPGAYKFVQQCSDCGEPNGVEYPVSSTDLNQFGTTQGAASLLGNGSIIAICSFMAVVIAAAAFIWLRRRRMSLNNKKDKGDNED